MAKYSVYDSDSQMIDLSSLVDFLQLFNFVSTRRDKDELKFYLFNQGVVEQSMKQHTLRKDKLYIDVDVLFASIRKHYAQMGLTP